MAKCQTLIALCHVKITNQFRITLFLMKKPAFELVFVFYYFLTLLKIMLSLLQAILAAH